MIARRAVAIRRATFARAVINTAPPLSRTQYLIDSGLIDRAADITQLAHQLTDAAIRAMEAECANRGRRAARAIREIRSLRSAAFEGIAGAIIKRLEERRR